MESGSIRSWEEFVVALKIRFAPSDYDDPVGAFTKLQQTSTVDEYQYQSQFEVLSNRIPGLTEYFRVSSFVSGLKEEVRIMVTMLKPTTLPNDFGLARLQEQEICRRNRNSKSQNWSSNSFYPRLPTPSYTNKPTHNQLANNQFSNPYPNRNTTYPYSGNTIRKPTLPIRRISPSQMQERREKGLCYYCDEKYQAGYKCNKPRLLVLEGMEWEEKEETVEEELLEFQGVQAPGEAEEGELLGISLYALAGTPTPRTMRLMGSIGSVEVVILIDTESTHNFVDPNVARKAQLLADEKGQLTVMVADGATLSCQGQCKAVSILLQSCKFSATLHLLTLGGCDVVLGVDWLRCLGPILWDFGTLTMKFPYNHQKVTLQGMLPTPELLDARETMPKSTGASCKGVWVQLMEITADQPRTMLHLAVQELIEGYPEVFKELEELPPSRSHDHQILLKDEAKPMCVRPYRYPYYQKGEIEKLVQEMLSSRVIRPSQSPYSSLVLLVRKADGSWRMCVDYRALNRDTIKDKYPIPNIDELLDELHGVVIFSKLDLRSGYHQIRMKPEDMPKTTFRTHEGHYKFLVMPFGLTNAPSTFQGLMNEVFQPYLRKFVLVFFDDILVYSLNLKEHLKHLRLVLEVLKEHQLYAKASKCKFGSLEVDYLGRVLSEEGVKADPAKIVAMKNWPNPRIPKALRGFLGLTGYYRKFVKGYGGVAAPLTTLLKKNSFGWNASAEEAFRSLKELMSTPPVLGSPDFTKRFLVECDASGAGIGAVLMQEGRPLAYLSQGLKKKSLFLSMYEKELLALVMVVRKWMHYLSGQTFVVRTDQQALKYLLKQRIGTPAQQKWVFKLLGYDFTVEYKRGRENKAADALSRVPFREIEASDAGTMDETDNEAGTHAELVAETDADADAENAKPETKATAQSKSAEPQINRETEAANQSDISQSQL